MAGVGARPSKAELAKQNAAPNGTVAKTATQLSSEDRQFILMAAKANVAGIQMGHLAAQQAQSEVLKKMGSQVAADHQKASAQLASIAQRKGENARVRPDKLGFSKQEMANFDRAWVESLINDQQRKIAMYQRAAQQSADPELQAYARTTLPILRRHLKMAQDAQQKMGSGASASNVAGETGNAGSTTSRGR